MDNCSALGVPFLRALGVAASNVGVSENTGKSLYKEPLKKDTPFSETPILELVIIVQDSCLKAPWDFVATYTWTYNPTYNSSKWPGYRLPQL